MSEKMRSIWQSTPVEQREQLNLVLEDRVHKPETYRGDPVLLDISLDELPEYFQSVPELAVNEKDPEPFLLLRSSGIHHLSTICQFLEVQKIEYLIQDLPNFDFIARYLYGVDNLQPLSPLWFVVAKHYANLIGNGDNGVLIILPKELLKKYDEVTKLKKEIRNLIGNTEFIVFTEDKIIQTGLHHIHAPDFDELSIQYNTIIHLLTIICRKNSSRQ